MIRRLNDILYTVSPSPLKPFRVFVKKVVIICMKLLKIHAKEAPIFKVKFSIDLALKGRSVFQFAFPKINFWEPKKVIKTKEIKNKIK